MVGATRRSAVAVLAVAAILALAGCTDAPADPGDRPPSTTPSAEETAPPAGPEPELIPEGTAEENLPYFDFVNSALLADGNPGGRRVVDNLVAAGFDVAAMQVTADRTPLGSAVDSLQFSVQVGDECLIGHADSAGYTSTVAPALKSGGCLLGKTRPIDWDTGS